MSRYEQEPRRLNYSKIFLVLLIFALGIYAFSSSSELNDPIVHTNVYLNASHIIGTGFSSTSGDNVALISEINNGHWEGVEQNGVGWHVDINFTNVTDFTFYETDHRYFSTSGTPSQHIVTREIFCITQNQFVELEQYSNQDEWFYNSKNIPDTNHFIYPNHTVFVRFNHTDNGNSNHRIWIDANRLILVNNTIKHI